MPGTWKRLHGGRRGEGGEGWGGWAEDSRPTRDGIDTVALALERIGRQAYAAPDVARVEGGRIDRHAVAPGLAGGQAQLCGFAIRRIGQRRDGTSLLLLHAGMLARERAKRGAWPDFKQDARTATVYQAPQLTCEAHRCEHGSAHV